jgi:hypothetical protein
LVGKPCLLDCSYFSILPICFGIGYLRNSVEVCNLDFLLDIGSYFGCCTFHRSCFLDFDCCIEVLVGIHLGYILDFKDIVVVGSPFAAVAYLDCILEFVVVYIIILDNCFDNLGLG